MNRAIYLNCLPLHDATHHKHMLQRTSNGHVNYEFSMLWLISLSKSLP